MITRLILLLVFTVLAAYGAFGVITRARGMRAERKYKDVIFRWQEHPYSNARYDRLSWLATSSHWVAVVVLGFLELIIIALASFPEELLPFLRMIILLLVVSLAGYLYGAALFQPVGLQLAGDRHYALAEEGILFGGSLIPWSAFTHFGFVPGTNMIRLWSASFPGAIPFMFSPHGQDLPTILEILHSHLPDESTRPVPSLARQWSFPLLMTTVSWIPVLITVFFAIQLSADVALVVNGFLIYILAVLGGPVLLRSILGKEIRPAPLEE